MAKTVTALRADRPGRVAVELDGTPWRTLPLEAVLQAGLTAGRPLERERARTLARELRRLRALQLAGRALHYRARSVEELDGRLEAHGVAPAERTRALETLSSAGLVDDARFATSRARALADRGSGNELIRFDLENRGIAAEAIAAALESLEPERDRVERIVRRRGASPTTARYLGARGFSEDSLEGVVTGDLGDPVG